MYFLRVGTDSLKQNYYNKENVKTWATLLFALSRSGFPVDSSIEFYQFCIVLKFGFIVEPSIILSSPMLPIFFSNWLQMKFVFVFMLIRRTRLANIAAVFLF